MADDKILEHPRSDLDRGIPSPGEIRAHEAFTGMLAELLRYPVGVIGIAFMNDAPCFCRPGFDRDVAIDAAGKAGTESDRQTAEPAQIGGREIFLHPGVDENVDGLNNDEIE